VRCLGDLGCFALVLCCSFSNHSKTPRVAQHFDLLIAPLKERGRPDAWARWANAAVYLQAVREFQDSVFPFHIG